MIPLKIILGNDLLPWERELFSGLISALDPFFNIERIDFLDDLRALKSRPSGIWFVSRGWKEAVRHLKDWPADLPALITVVDTNQSTGSWHSLLWEKWETPSVNQRFLCLSPFTYRFLSEMKGLTKAQLHFMPLPFPLLDREMTTASNPLRRPKLRVGTFSKFSSENNLHQLVTVAHYVAQRNPNVEFHLMGYGPLARHLRNMVSTLNLESTVIVKETIYVAEIQNLDLFLYLPIRNDHFGTLLYASHYGLPVIANELPGIEDLIVEGKTGFIVPPHDTKTLGELILRVESNRELKDGMSAALRSHLKSQFPLAMAVDQMARIFGISETTIKAVSLAS